MMIAAVNNQAHIMHFMLQDRHWALQKVAELDSMISAFLSNWNDGISSTILEEYEFDQFIQNIRLVHLPSPAAAAA